MVYVGDPLYGRMVNYVINYIINGPFRSRGYVVYDTAQLTICLYKTIDSISYIFCGSCRCVGYYVAISFYIIVDDIHVKVVGLRICIRSISGFQCFFCWPLLRLLSVSALSSFIGPLLRFLWFLYKACGIGGGHNTGITLEQQILYY